MNLRCKVVLFLSLGLIGCQEVVQESQPTIAHVHIGHSLTGWVDTPNKAALFVVAEQEAKAIRQRADEATKSSDVKTIKKLMREIVAIISHDEENPAAGHGFYGFKRAFAGAMNHIEFASEADDASANVRREVPEILIGGLAVRERAETLQFFAQEVVDATSIEDVELFIVDVKHLADQLVVGEEIDGVAGIGTSPEEVGLSQLRASISEMIHNESPAYQPVAQRYLFGLVRLDNGSWTFANTALGDGSASGY